MAALVPKPALSFEEMWDRLKQELAAQVTSKRTPQAVFNMRDLMSELERQRIAPLVSYVRERSMDRKFEKFRKAG